jgi:hypothetical protein
MGRFRFPGGRRVFLGVLACAVVVAAAAVVRAQQRGGAAPPAPQFISATTAEVKPESIQALQDLLKNEQVPALKKAGVPWRLAYANGPFGQGFTITLVQPIANFAQYDQQGAMVRAVGADAAAKFNAKLRPMILGTRTVVLVYRPDLSVQGPPATTPAPFLIVTTVRTNLNRADDFAALVKSDVLPAYKKAGIKDMSIYGTVFGGPDSDFVVGVPMVKYAELDLGSPFDRGMTAEGRKQLSTKAAGIVLGAETIVARYLPDLSYGPPPAPAAAAKK